jgi:hypothetical protein
MGDWFFEPEFSPRLKPGEAIRIKDEFYEVVETRPMAPWYFKLTNITIPTPEIDLRDAGLKAAEGELLNFRIRIDGPVLILLRVEGAAGPIVGGWGKAERFVDEGTPPELLELLMLGERDGWLIVRFYPIVTPAWARLKAYGYVYTVRKLAERPARYTVPAYISKPIAR